MSSHGDTTFDWGDGTYKFRLGLREVRELQEKTGLGPLALFNRIRRDEWFVDDLRETLRLGLIGGDVKPPAVTALIQRYFDLAPKIDAKEPAMKILMAFLVGDPDDPVGKDKAAGDANGAMESSPSPQSTASAAP